MPRVTFASLPKIQTSGSMSASSDDSDRTAGSKKPWVRPVPSPAHPCFGSRFPPTSPLSRLHAGAGDDDFFAASSPTAAPTSAVSSCASSVLDYLPADGSSDRTGATKRERDDKWAAVTGTDLQRLFA